LLRECDGGESKAWKYSFEIKTTREAMGQESSYTTGTTSGPFRGTPQGLAASTGTLAQMMREQQTSDKTQAVTSQDARFKRPNPFREKMELPNNNLHSILKKPAILNVPLPHVDNSKEQSHSKTNTIVAQVHQLSSSKRLSSPPPSPAITIEVTDSPPLSSTVVINEAVTAESTDF
jgi:hypothetical protein